MVTNELSKDSAIRKIRITADDGKTYNTNCYNLDCVISVGYRVNSKRATQFRIWATQILKQYMLNGYAINQERIEYFENKIDQLSIEITKIHKTLLTIANRPIVIHSHNNNQIHLASKALETKAIELIDELIKQIKKDRTLCNQLQELKTSIKEPPQDQKTKNKISKFLDEIQDEDSNTYKKITAAGITKDIIVELAKLSIKLKEWFF